MATGRASPEYRTMVALTTDLRLAVKCDLLNIGGQLLANGLISPDNEDSLRNMMLPEGTRAADCVKLITTKVEEDPQNYHVFVGVLQADPFQNKSILSKLQQTYTKFRQQLRQQPQPRAHPQPAVPAVLQHQVAPPVHQPTTKAVPPVAQTSGAPHVQGTGSDSSSAAYVTHSSPPVRVNPAPSQSPSPPEISDTQATPSGFNCSMSEEDFLKFLRNEGLSNKDCEMLKKNGITASCFSECSEDEVDKPELGFTYGGKKVLKRVLKNLPTCADSGKSAPLEFKVNDRTEVSIKYNGESICFEEYKPFKSQCHSTNTPIKFTFGNVTPKSEEKISSIPEYEMKTFPHGIALIINNESFTRNLAKQHRLVTRLDERNLIHTFRYLGYKVEVHRELDFIKMNNVISEMAKRDHHKYDSFVCCILSHGIQGHVFGIEGIEITTHKIAEIFDADHCHSLYNKPKLFFLQACRGPLSDESVDVRSDGEYKPTRTKSTEIPHMSDFFFGYATPLGYQAWRDCTHGSWYISELCRTLCERSTYTSFSDIMTEVCKRVANNDKHDDLGYRMTPERTERLLKNIFF